MKALIQAVKFLLGMQTPMLTNSDPAGDKLPKPEPLPLDIYQDLPNIGKDRQTIMEMIAERFPEMSVKGFQYPHVRHNRRALYMSIHFLRTVSKRRWGYDVLVERGEYTQDKLSKTVAATQQGHLRAV
jgi:hypothetical protein